MPRLRAAVSDRYRIERELGRGGMGRPEAMPAISPDGKQVACDLVARAGRFT